MAFRRLEPRVRAALAGVLIACVAAVDWRVDLNIAFGFLYLFPMIVLGTVLPRWAVALVAAFCTGLSDLFDPFAFSLAFSVPQDILVFAALAGAGLFSHEVMLRERREKQDRLRLEREAAARREAEEQLEFIIESSPAAILTMYPDGRIERANPAAHGLFGLGPGELTGRTIGAFIPALGRISARSQTFRTEMQCRGERQNGEIFVANVFFSTYSTTSGPRLAALVVDSSEELRDREESSLEQLMAGSRILVAAVSHEIRNVCGAIRVVYENLARSGELGGSKDFAALGSLVETLHRIASVELSQGPVDAGIGAVDLNEALGDLRIVIDPYCKEAEIDVGWDVPKDLPPVWADRTRLLQVLLNLTKNSERALEHAPDKRIQISARAGAGMVSIRVADTGPGIGSTAKLFQPFQEGAVSTGLGLYLSRAFLRACRGEIRHEPSPTGCCFVIELAVAGRGDLRQDRVAYGPHTITAG